MKISERAYKKVYYQFCKLIISQTPCKLPTEYEHKLNLFIYFDYEREFGGHKTNISDRNIFDLLDELNTYGIKTTWFIVGKIFEKYPDSIKEISRNCHEIASHSFGHKAPFRISGNLLKNDFELFEKSNNSAVKSIGFHSPNGLWSLSLLKNLKRYNYIYDVIGIKTNETTVPLLLHNKKARNIVRLKTLGDDWPLYNRQYTESEVFHLLTGKIEGIKAHYPAGIGFHPWILFSDPEIYNGFRRFIKTISKNSEYNIRTASNFAEVLLKNSENKK